MASKDLPYATGGGAEPELHKDGAGSSWVEREGGVDSQRLEVLRSLFSPALPRSEHYSLQFCVILNFFFSTEGCDFL